MLKAILHRLAVFFAPKSVPQLGRNQPCHCGSGRKYKKCCLEKDAARLRSERDAAASAAGNYVGGKAGVANQARQRANEYRPPKVRQGRGVQ